MTGLIWTIQLLHYPAFEFVEKIRFGDFHSRHSRVITFIVAPVMLLELISGGWLLLMVPINTVFQLNLTALILIWLFTFLLSVPLHNSLAQSFDSLLIKKLVQTNWPRTLLWSLRLIILTTVLIRYLDNANVGI